MQLAGNQVPGTPRRQLWSQLEFRLAAFTGGLELRRVGEYFANDFNGPPPGVDKPRGDYVNRAFTTVGARLALRSGWPRPLELFAGADNLLDAAYSGSVVPNAFGDRFFEPAPGRSAHAGLSLLLN